MVLYHHQHAENNLFKQSFLCFDMPGKNAYLHYTRIQQPNSENNAKMMNLTYP